VETKPISIEGFRFAAVAAGIKHADSDRLDLGLIVSDVPASAAQVTTTNLVCAAPVKITRQRMAGGRCSAVLVNSGNANAYTGDRGLRDAQELTRAVSDELGISEELVIPMSTGVIGNPLPLERMKRQVPGLVRSLKPESLPDVARAMMTTDTKPKTVCVSDEIAGSPARVVGLAKGSGMIAPNMATLLVVILADLRADAAFLKEALVEATRKSFNAMTVDGDTSTNDTAVLLAGGHARARDLGHSARDREIFCRLLDEACGDLALQLVRDGEGASKAVTVRVCGAPDNAAAAVVARTISESLLVKTAFNGEDPNWGRIICAAGRAGVPFDPDRVDLFIGDVPIVSRGLLVQSDWESAAQKVMRQAEFSILVDLKAGAGEALFLTTDLSKEYVSINADYRS
jgi:glutamate N-acetyltransferase/amino-acid N-acetyltransferase